MKGTETKLMKYMEGANKRISIPIYQRNYDWKIENCKRLYDDLIAIIKKRSEKREQTDNVDEQVSHFFGCIVSTYNPKSYYEEFYVIDGQQRITTVTLILLAMYNLLKQDKIVSEDKNLKDKIYEIYLVDKWKPANKRIKLKLVKGDRSAFNKLFEEKSEQIKGSNLTINYNYFYERIQKMEISVDELFEALISLEIIDIKLDDNDDPQMIFESLNSTGLALSEGDKIRNYVLMNLSPKKQEEYYENYWYKIEKNTEYHVDLFIRDYLSIKRQLTPPMKRIYFEFREYVQENRIDIELLLIDLLNYSQLYKILIGGCAFDREIDACIERLNRIETTVIRPFFLEVLRLENKGDINKEDVKIVFQAVENYLFRRIICDLSTNRLNKVFLLLHREIIRYDNTSKDYAEKLKYALLSKKEGVRFPDDSEFLEAFSSRQVYNMRAKNKMYIFERLENFKTREDKDIYRHFDEGDYSVEHIMPQKLSPQWVESLGSNYRSIHETWLHRIANLTITAYNSRYGNYSFQEKRDMSNGFKESGIRLNQLLTTYEDWGEKQLIERNDFLKKRALKTWEYPTTSYEPFKKQIDYVTLDDEIDLTGKTIISYTYLGLDRDVKSWIEMYEEVIKYLYSRDSSVIIEIATQEDKNGLPYSYFSDRKENLRYVLELDDGIYAEKNTSTNTKIILLRRLFEFYDLDFSDLVFYLKDDSKNK
ncbi:MAG: DUF262 domain-containing protein [Christensenellaceae bacterium]|nr:DUF262 domain-containing protein [Christensenellaceae bacterium]